MGTNDAKGTLIEQSDRTVLTWRFAFFPWEVSGRDVLTKAALDAVKKWKYEPTLLNGQPVEVETTIDVIFQLNKKD